MSQHKSFTRRVSVALWGIPLIVLAIYLGGWIFSLFTAVIASVALYEFYTLAEWQHTNPQKVPAVLLAFFAVFSAAFLPVGWWIGLMFLAGIALAFLDIRFGEWDAWRDLPLTLFGWVYLPFFLGLLVYLRGATWNDGNPSAAYTLYIFTAIWICDTAAYAGGKTLGRHKMSPRVSPNKTWEGALFGLAGALLWAVVWFPFLAAKTTFTDLLFVAFTVGVLGQLGDLIESYFKRCAGVKDSGTLLPEHGGAWDRFDSLILSAPAIFIYQAAVGHIGLF